MNPDSAIDFDFYFNRSEQTVLNIAKHSKSLEDVESFIIYM